MVKNTHFKREKYIFNHEKSDSLLNLAHLLISIRTCRLTGRVHGETDSGQSQPSVCGGHNPPYLQVRAVYVQKTWAKCGYPYVVSTASVRIWEHADTP